MKTSKKILGIVLALVMLLNVVAVVSFAGYPDDASVKLSIRADKASYAPGETVTFTVSQQVTAEVGKMTIGGAYEIGYNSAGLETIATANGGETLESHGFAIPNETIKAGYDATISQIIPAFAISDEDAAAYSWDKVIVLSAAEAGATVDARSAWAVDCTDAPVDFFTFQMKIPAGAADGTYKIGFSSNGYINYNAYSNDLTNMGLYGNSGADMGLSTEFMYEFGTCDVVVGAPTGGDDSGDEGGEGGSEPAIVVTNEDTQVQWTDPADVNNKNINVAFRGVIEGYTPEVAAGELASLSKIGVCFSKSDSTPTVEEGATVVEAWTIYDFTSGKYFFRAVVGNIEETATETLYANAFIVLADGTRIDATDDVLSTTYQASLAAGIANGMASK